MKNLCILCILFLAVNISKGQDGFQGGGGGSSSGESPLDLANERADIIPHSPEAEAMAKYGVLPVTLYTGLPDISIPIFDIKASTFSMPFSFSYNYNGYKPTETSSCVGLGWSIQGGGVITRIVEGLVDDDQNIGTGHHYYDFVNVNTPAVKQDFLTEVGTSVTDGAPDIYVLSVGDISCKFIMIKGKAYVFPYQNIQISTYQDGFKVIDDKGNTYIFNDYETTYHKSSGGPSTPVHKSAWFLSQVTSADKQDVVNFSYTSYSYKQPTTYLDIYSINQSPDYQYGSNTSGHSYNTEIFDGDHIDSKLLTQVTSKYGNISFILSSTNRLDITTCKSVSEVIVTGPSGSGFRKDINLTQGYFGTNQKLELKAIDWADQHYSFEYQDGTLPPADTKGIDMWGYYNGATFNAMLFTKESLDGIVDAIWPFANRDPNQSYSNLCILKKITYPTGGYSTFSYQQNQTGHYYVTSNYTPKSFTISTPYDPNNHDANNVTTVSQSFTLTKGQTVTIHYGSNGETQQQIPTYSVMSVYKSGVVNPVYTAPIFQSTDDFGSDNIYLDAGTYTCAVYTKQLVNVPITNNGGVDYNDYAIDNTLQNAPGLRVNQISSYDNMGGSSPALVKNYAYSEGVALLNSGFTSNRMHNMCEDFFVVTHEAAAQSAFSALESNEFYYQQVTETDQDSHATGQTYYTFLAEGDDNNTIKPISQTESKYDVSTNSFLPVHSISYTYQTTNRNVFFSLKSETYEQMGPICPTCFGCSEYQSPDITQPSVLQTAYQNIPQPSLRSDYTNLMSQTETYYDNNGQAFPSRTTSYSYNKPEYLYPNKISTTDSKGQTVTTEIKYPMDYNLNNSSTAFDNINTNFKANLSNADVAYSNCFSSLESALQPYQPFSTHQSQFTSVANSYHCETNFKTSVSTALSQRDNDYATYQSALSTGITNNSINWQKSILWMQQNNILSTPIETYVSVKRADNNEYLLSATRNEYQILTSQSQAQAVMPVAIKQAEISSDLLKSTFLTNTDNYYLPQISFTYDNQFNLSSQNLNNNIQKSYLWNYQNTKPVSEIINASATEVAYTSFEGDNQNNWTYTGTPTTDKKSPTGGSCYLLAPSSPVSTASNFALDVHKQYIVSYWSKNTTAFTVTGTQGTPVKGQSIGGWTYHEHLITGVSSATISFPTGSSGSIKIDEVRLYPVGAQMTTYTYDPVMGITSKTDPNNAISYFEYDGIGRLRTVRDEDRNIIKKYAYNFANHTFNPNQFYNQPQVQAFAKTNCSDTSMVGIEQLDSVEAATFSSDFSQGDADTMAINYLDSIGQSDANVNGACAMPVFLTLVNYDHITDFTLTLTDVYDSTRSFTVPFPIDSAVTTQKIPQGRYNIAISKPGNTDSHVFTASGPAGSIQVNSATASWTNVYVNTDMFDKLTIGIPQ